MSTGKEKVVIAWLKRDLRIKDNSVLSECLDFSLERTKGGEETNCLAFYCIENEYWNTNKASREQWGFVYESLMELKATMRSIGAKLHIFHANAADETFQELVKTYHVSAVFSHQETGNLWTFERDKKVNRILGARGIPHYSLLQNGVGRGNPKTTTKIADNNLWWTWAKTPLANPISNSTWRNLKNPPPKHLTQWEKTPEVDSSNKRQPGGESEASMLIDSFFEERALMGSGYRKELGSPILAHLCCSRLSAHITWGNISTKTIAQRAIHIINSPYSQKFLKTQAESFLTRTRWRDHFIQKFELLWWMENQCINRGAENLHTWNEEYYQRWANGMTGYPFLDACMRSLNETKWLNFRARAMLVSFAAYALDLDWRGFGPHLARNFLDYEPGIHYSQLQMQSGTTIGSPPRIYNPIKQSIEKDPEGQFIRKWVPELRDQPKEKIHFPLLSPQNNYPTAIIPAHNLYRVMRANGPKKKQETNQLELLTT
jgi:deoxyribodipyrimidine photo-lyase